MTDYCDGSTFQEHPLYKDHPDGLQIQLYYDDLEICNPLGSKVNKHKLALFYYTLGNIPPQHRSTLLAIQLLTIVKSQFLTKYGIDKILEPTIQAVAKLEEVRLHIYIAHQYNMKKNFIHVGNGIHYQWTV